MENSQHISTKLMGGYNSGGWNRKGRPVLEQCVCFNIQNLKDSNALTAGTSGLVLWGRNAISFNTSDEDSIFLDWRTPGNEEIFEQRIGFQWRNHKRFGGHQVYVFCPWCLELRTKLYLFANKFLCRKCHALPYVSQREREGDRVQRKLQKLSRSLNCVYEWGVNQIPPRPNGMHQKRYEVLYQKYSKALVRLQVCDSATINKIMVGFARLQS